MRHFVTIWQSQTNLASKLRFLWSKVRRRMPAPAANGPEREEESFVAHRIPRERHSRWEVYHRINQDYVAEPYDGAVTVFRSSRLQERYPNGDAGYWRDISPRVEICDIEGDHWTCVTRHVNDVGRKMRGYLPAAK